MVGSALARICLSASVLALAWLPSLTVSPTPAIGAGRTPAQSTGSGQVDPAAAARRLLDRVGRLAHGERPRQAERRQRGPSRREEGDLLRVAGLDLGHRRRRRPLVGDDRGLRRRSVDPPASGEWADSWQCPDASEAPNGFWVEVTSPATVRAGPTLNAPVVGTLEPAPASRCWPRSRTRTATRPPGTVSTAGDTPAPGSTAAARAECRTRSRIPRPGRGGDGALDRRRPERPHADPRPGRPAGVCHLRQPGPRRRRHAERPVSDRQQARVRRHEQRPQPDRRPIVRPAGRPTRALLSPEGRRDPRHLLARQVRDRRRARAAST